MPIYEYKCRKGHLFDVMQRIADDPVDSCEVCGAVTSRVMHPPAVHFKGSGFYNTDYGTRRRSRENKENEGSSSSDGAATKADTKPADSKTSSEPSKAPAAAASSD